jgi:hypothetical protein
METFIVRIYRRLFGKPDNIVGLTEHVESGKKSRFENMEELREIIMEKEGGVQEEND